MNILGVQLFVWVGPTVPTPLSPTLVESIDHVKVFTSDNSRSGFQITFRIGRGPYDLFDHGYRKDPRINLFSRVILIVAFNARPYVLMDGIITNHQMSPSEEAGGSTLTVTGEDVSVMMDMEERSQTHPMQRDDMIVLLTMPRYAQYAIVPRTLPPATLRQPMPTDPQPVTTGTDLEFLRDSAARSGLVFYVEPSEVPGTNVGYWGPPVQPGAPQSDLTVNMGNYSNVKTINFEHNGMAFELVEGQVQDAQLGGTSLPVQTFASTRPPIVMMPAWLTQSQRRVRQYRSTGVDVMQAMADAQAQTDSSEDEVVKVTGELDAVKYNGVLRPRRLVTLSGAGHTFNGLYLVKQVTHNIRPGSYSQSFTLARGGTGSITPAVLRQ